VVFKRAGPIQVYLHFGNCGPLKSLISFPFTHAGLAELAGFHPEIISNVWAFLPPENPTEIDWKRTQQSFTFVGYNPAVTKKK
jgi:hypothetical protein